jgi:hypothetical protein
MEKIMGFMLFIKELWDKITIVAIISVLGFLGGGITAFVAWRIDRGMDKRRLTELEKNKDKMETKFELHEKDNIADFKAISNNVRDSNQAVLNKIDKLHWFLIHAKITLKGEENGNKEERVQD